MDNFQEQWKKFWVAIVTIAVAVSTIAAALGGINFVGLENLKDVVGGLQAEVIPVADPAMLNTRTQSGLSIYKTPGGKELVIGSGGTLTIASGGTLNQASGAASNWVCATTPTFTETLTITPTALSTVDHVVVSQVTAPVSTASILTVSDASGASITIKSYAAAYSAGTTGVVAEYCMYGTP